MLKSSGGVCRRAGTRTTGLVLSERERSELRAMLRKARECGTGLVARRRLDVEPSGLVRETRVISRTACGLRWCVKCEAGARRYRSERAVGPWGMMTTLTLDPAVIGLRTAWRKMPRWVGVFIRRLQRSVEADPAGPVRVHPAAKEERERWGLEQPNRTRAIPAVVYAWAIEPHESGFPHAHLCLGLDYLDYDWARVQWRRITGMRRVSPQHDHLKTVLKASRYLSKYVTKAVFPADLCIATKRKRLFWSAVPLAWKPPAGWVKVDRGGTTELEKMLVGESISPVGMAWSDVGEPSEDYRKQERFHASDFASWADMASGVRMPPADWDGLWSEWGRMAIGAAARCKGSWNAKQFHDERRILKEAMRSFVVRCLAVKFAWGWSIQYRLRRWRPARPGLHLAWLPAVAAVPRCRFCRPLV